MQNIEIKTLNTLNSSEYLFEQIQNEKFFNDLVNLNEFKKFILISKNKLNLNNSDETTQSILNKLNHNNLLFQHNINYNTSPNLLSFDEFKNLVNFFNSIEHEQSLNYKALIAYYAILFMKPSVVFDNLSINLGLEENLFKNIFNSNFNNYNICALDNNKAEELPLIQYLINHITFDYSVNSEINFSHIYNLVSLQKYNIPVIFNSFHFANNNYNSTLLNTHINQDFFEYGNNVYNLKKSLFHENSRPVWFQALAHTAEILNKNLITSFDFINLASSFMKIIMIIENDNMYSTSKTKDIHTINNSTFISTFMNKLSLILDNNLFNQIQSAQLSVLLTVFEDILHTQKEKYDKNDSYLNNFVLINNNLTKLQNCYPHIIKDPEYNLKKYSLLLCDLPSTLFLFAESNLSQLNKISFFNIVINLIKKITNNINDDYKIDEIFDLQFSYSSLLNEKPDFDIFGNYSILYNTTVSTSLEYSDYFLSLKTQDNKISLFHSLHNPTIVNELSDKQFTFINTLDKFDMLDVLKEYATSELKSTIETECKEIINIFLKPRTTGTKFSMNNFFQFNLLSEQKFIETSLFQQILFRNSNISLPAYFPFFFENYLIKNISFYDNEQLFSLFENFSAILEMNLDKKNAINLFTQNRYTFSNKEELIICYFNLIEHIALSSLSIEKKQTICDYNNNRLVS